MKLPRRRFLHLAAGLAALPGLPRVALAQAYPARPVRVIVPFAPGGPTDVFARIIAAKLSEQTGRQFYIENVAGAGGNTGSARAAQASPDGYTVLVTGGGHLNNPFLYSHVPYDPMKDFEAVTLGASQPVVLTVHPSVPAQSVKELIALVKANPANTATPRPASERRRSLSASCSGSRSHLTSFTCPSTAAARRSAPPSRATRRHRSVR
jgi:tripartite-type tricarboxylate transporter receptor subunit TctC